MAPTANTIEEARDRFLTAVRRARLSASLNVAQERLVQELVGTDGETGQFARLSTAAGSAKGKTQASLEDRAAEMARMRAYVLPLDAVRTEAQAAVAEMSQWRVPDSVLAELKMFVQGDIATGTEAQARAALYAIFDDYDYWDSYSDWYTGLMQQITACCLGIIMLCIIGAGCSVWREEGLWLGLICGGLIGALSSVIAKLPPLSVYGEASAYVFRVISRVTTGLVASLVGFGLLASGLINVRVGDVSPREIIQHCISGSCAREVKKPSAAADEAGTGGAIPVAHEASLNASLQSGAASIPSDAGARTELDAGVSEKGKPVVGDPDVPTDGCRTCELAPASAPCCPRTGVVVLIILCVLFGFSERALSSFEETIFGKDPGSSRPPPEKTPPDPPGNPSPPLATENPGKGKRGDLLAAAPANAGPATVEQRLVIAPEGMSDSEGGFAIPPKGDPGA